jgi:hypothetical protein
MRTKDNKLNHTDRMKLERDKKKKDLLMREQAKLLEIEAKI